MGQKMVMMKAPITNIQAAEKSQTLSSNLYEERIAGFGRLGFLWMLKLGIWNF
jgi:hypothetical protein